MEGNRPLSMRLALDHVPVLGCTLPVWKCGMLLLTFLEIVLVQDWLAPPLLRAWKCRIFS
jgi:hypothetical protein